MANDKCTKPISEGQPDALQVERTKAELAAIRAMTPRRKQTPSEMLVREDRDNH
jgi:hypothetical protein